MTKVDFTHIDDVITSFNMSGHCNFSESNDIVCAAVSSAAYLVANTITEEYGFSADIDLDETNGGQFFLSISLEDAKKCRQLLRGFKQHLLSLQEQYPNNISIQNSYIN